MSDPIGYLLVRLDEEEMLAISAPRGPWGVHLGHLDGYPQQIISESGQSILVAETFDGPVDSTGLRRSPSTALFIAAWSPTRIFAEIKAKRAILEVIVATPHEEWCEAALRAGTPRCQCTREERVADLLAPLLGVYADRPDFDPTREDAP